VAVPVYDDYKVQETPCHGDIGGIRCPHLIRPCYLHTTQQIGIDFMTWCWRASPGTSIDGLEPRYSHQTLNTFPVDPISLILQPRGMISISGH